MKPILITLAVLLFIGVIIANSPWVAICLFIMAVASALAAYYWGKKEAPKDQEPE